MYALCLAGLLGGNIVTLAYVYTSRPFVIRRFTENTLFVSKIPQDGGSLSYIEDDCIEESIIPQNGGSLSYIDFQTNVTVQSNAVVKPYEVFYEESKVFTDSALSDFVPTKQYSLSDEPTSKENKANLQKPVQEDFHSPYSVTRSGITTRAWESLTDHKEKHDNFSTIDNEPKNAWQVIESVVEAPEDDFMKPVLTLEEYFKGKPLEHEDEENIRQLWSMIKERGVIPSLSEEDRSKLVDALTVAHITLEGKQTTRSLEKQINRAVGVAGVLGDLEQPLDVFLAGILNEVVASLVSVKAFDHVGTLVQLFGREAISLADMYTRLPKFFARKTEYTPMQSENQVQMLVQMAEEPRVLLLRLADRLHTMRHLGSMPLDDLDRVKISHESLNVYAPLAHKMGLMDMKNEFEDLSFEHLQPIEFEKATCTQTDAHKAYHDAANSITEILSHDPLLLSMNVTFKMTYRVKARYQLYCKMLKKGLKSSQEVRDALGLRIIVSSPKQPWDTDQDHIKHGADICYYLVERLRNMPGWEPECKNGFKDYIAGAKENGYQSLHQYIRHVALNSNVEVQVRTQAMHQFAELGEAAHWCYKDLIYRPEIANSRYYKIAWRSPRQMKVKTPQELIGLARIQLKQTRVFVYLEDKSTVFNLKRGSTALDVAFGIHTDVGLSAASIKINGRPVSFGNAPKTGDVISVQCAEEGQVQAKTSWLSMVQTRHAKFALQRYFNENQSSTLVCLGLLQLLMILFNNRDRITARYGGKILDADMIQSFCKVRTKMNISAFLARLGTISPSREGTATLVQKLLDIPGSQLQISVQTAALIWGRMWDHHQGPAVPYIDELRLTVLIPFLFDVLPRDGVRDAFSIWSRVIGPRLISSYGIDKRGISVSEEPEEGKNDSVGTAVPDISTEAYSSRQDYTDRVVLSTQVPNKANLYYLQSDVPKIHIYRDYRGCLRDIYTNYPIGAYKLTPRPITAS